MGPNGYACKLLENGIATSRSPKWSCGSRATTARGILLAASFDNLQRGEINRGGRGAAAPFLKAQLSNGGRAAEPPRRNSYNSLILFALPRELEPLISP